MKVELGKWFLDVAKYIFTAVIISPVFKEIVSFVWMISIGIVLVLIFGWIGIILLKQKEGITKKR